jgi:hypothetical protein
MKKEVFILGKNFFCHKNKVTKSLDLGFYRSKSFKVAGYTCDLLTVIIYVDEINKITANHDEVFLKTTLNGKLYRGTLQKYKSERSLKIRINSFVEKVLEFDKQIN